MHDIHAVCRCKGGDAPLGSEPPPTGYNVKDRTWAGAAKWIRTRFPRTRLS